MKQWQNKIVGHDDVPPDQLMAHPENWRIHPKYQQEALRGVINDIGFIKSVTVNKSTGRVVDGHLRVTLALRDGIPTIPVEYVELTETEEAEALLTIDPIAALAGSDKQNLETLLAKVNTDDSAVMGLLDRLAEKPIDFQAEWQGMPEYNVGDPKAYRSISVHFQTKIDFDEFEDFIKDKIEQSVTDKTKSIWYPRPPESQTGLVFENES